MLAKSLQKKIELETWLDEVDYVSLNSSYVPSEFALVFMNFIKLVNGEEGEQHKTPPVHLKMLDKMVGTRRYVANLCFRGAAKTTLFMEYMTLYIAVMGNLPGFGDVSGMIYVSDSMDNGVKSARKNIEFRYNNSPFLQEWLPDVKFTDAYLEFTNRDGHKLGVKMFGAKALSVDSTLFLGSGGTTTIGECSVGDVIIGADGRPTTITRKSEVFYKPMYKLTLDDGRTLKVSEDHLNQVHIKKFASERTFSKFTLEEKTLTTLELLQEPLFAVDPNGSNRPLLWVENAKPIEWPENQNQLIDPYTVGILLGDGSMNTKSNKTAPVVLTAHEDDWPTYEQECPYFLGSAQRDARNPAVISRTVLGIGSFVAIHGLNTHGKFKKVPDAYKYASVAQRLSILQGLMDTDGTCTLDGKSSFCSSSKELVEDVMWLCRSLGGESRWQDKGNDRAYQCSVRLNMPLFRLVRKLERQRGLRNDKVSIKSIERIADEPSQCIAVDNDERQFLANDFFRTHNTGIRGTKIFGKRPTLCILDDLVSDDDAKSPTSMQAVKDTVYKGVFPALDPTRRKVVFNGTPFNKDDIIIEAVESGAWDVNVWPVCERFPCEQEEFVGAWEDRFDYAFVKEQYDLMAQSGKLAAFYQEYMLRITSEEDRLIHDHDIRWYSRDSLLANKGIFHFYITTDFATSAKQSADYTVISVWAYNANGEWFWVDGIAARQTMDKTVNDLFSLVHEYQPLAVGVEITGQQGGFIPWLQEQMFTRNIWFTFASSEKSGAPGIRSAGDKLVRMNMVLPWFKAGKMHFPKEMQTSNIMGLFMGQLRLVTQNGIKGKDDCLDTISQLAYLKPWKPSQSRPVEHTTTESSYWTTPTQEAPSALSSYIV